MQLRPAARLLPQLLAFVALAAIGNALVRALRLPIPGSIAGLALLLLLFATGLAKVEWFQDGASFLFRHMLLFFVPAALGVVEYPDLLRGPGARVLVVVAVSTALVMAATALTVEWLARRAERREAPR